MKRLILAALAAALPFAASSGGLVAPVTVAGGGERVRVIVSYKNGQQAAATRALAMAGAEVHLELAEQRSYAVSVPAGAVDGLQRNPAISYVETDAKRYPLGYLSGETVPYGISMVQADQVADNGTNAGKSTVCIIDSGLDTGHPDHKASYTGLKIKGYSDAGRGSWSSASPSTWYTDENDHGTHVAGTIAALNNGAGVVGVAPNGGLNLYIVKVFGASGWAYSSSLVDALNRCTAGRDTDFPGTRLVVSMSLGGGLKSKTEETAFANAYSKGTLPIAAAGNDGNSRISYPAGYASVISVAAIDSSKAKASFSQYNSDVELAAPGVGVLSTVPRGTGSSAGVTVGATQTLGDAMDGSPQKTASGALVDCGLAGSTCSGATGKVCLIQRGTYDFATKVANCQSGGGVGAVIYNNTSGALLGTLNGASTTIPSIGIAQADGETLKGKLGQSASVAVGPSDYARFDGTSMATPHVSAVAALVWSYYPKCTVAQVRNALTATAEDLP
ncbi:MAG: S8 family serine peptidase, partial [Steroidobacteraceae bacterium]